MPPVLAGRIDYSPGAAGRAATSSRSAMPQGTLIKVAAVYDRPFWREQGPERHGASSLNGPVNATFDDSPPDGSPGVLFGFVGGDEARRFRGQSKARPARRGAARTSPTTSAREALQPARVLRDRLAGAALVARRPGRASPRPGCCSPTAPRSASRSGRIHWAGTETSTYWNGYMDGAVRSGERAAREVLDQL